VDLYSAYRQHLDH